MRIRISRRKAARFRRIIARNRCDARPGITHRWVHQVCMDPWSFGGVIEFWECEKCGAAG